MLNTKLKNICNKKLWINLVLVTIGVFLVAVRSVINLCANLGNNVTSIQSTLSGASFLREVLSC